MSDETGGAERPSPDGGGNGGPPAGGGRGGDSPDKQEGGASATKAAPSCELKRKKNDCKNDQTRWPWWGQLILAIVALATACGLLIVIPMYIVPKAIGDADGVSRSFMAMITVLIGLTTMTISGMFIFMTFRIDRGAKTEAREVAEKEAGKVAKKEARKAVDDKVGAAVEEAEKEAVRLVGERVRAAGEEAEGEVNSMVQDARRKIDEADIEKLVNERLDAFLEQADGWPRRLFLRFLRFLRLLRLLRREPGS